MNYPNQIIIIKFNNFPKASHTVEIQFYQKPYFQTAETLEPGQQQPQEKFQRWTTWEKASADIQD